MTPPTSRRERVRESTLQEIKAVARRQMAEQGAAALSLRGIAAEMGMTAPALYRYFASRDDLITALIVDGYTALADALAEGRDRADPADATARLLATGHAYRRWALAHPQDYALILGTPLAGYVAPREITLPAAQLGFDIMVDAAEAALAQAGATPSAESAGLVETWRARGLDVPPSPALHLFLAAWSLLHGLVSLEMFDHLPPIIGDPAELADAEMRALLRRFGLTPPPPSQQT